MSVYINLEEEECKLLLDVCESWLNSAEASMRAKVRRGESTGTKRTWKQERVKALMQKVSSRSRLPIPDRGLKEPVDPLDEVVRKALQAAGILR